MIHRFSREELLIGKAGLKKLRQARVAVFGIGGVGSYVVEALARSGVGALDLFDSDTVALSNINRQLIALESTLAAQGGGGQERVLQINPACRVEARQLFFTPESAGEVGFSQYDYVADAIDTETGKLELIRRCREAGVPVISCMGTGNKLDPTAFRVTAIEKTSGCPLARVMRRELKKRGIAGVKAVWSPEEPWPPPLPPATRRAPRAAPPRGAWPLCPARLGSSWPGDRKRPVGGDPQERRRAPWIESASNGLSGRF